MFFISKKQNVFYTALYTVYLLLQYIYELEQEKKFRKNKFKILTVILEEGKLLYILKIYLLSINLVIEMVLL